MDYQYEVLLMNNFQFYLHEKVKNLLIYWCNYLQNS